MDKWLKACTGAATMLAGAGVLHHFVFVQPDLERDHLEHAAVQRQGTARERAEREHCREAAQLLHDISWASACMLLAREVEVDDANECTLPDQQSAAIHAAERAAEERCLAASR